MGDMRSARRMRMRLWHRFAWGRCGLAGMVGVSVVNLVLLLFGVQYHFLLSAAVPYYLGWVCGQLGVGGWLKLLSGVVAVVILAVYGGCWFLSRRRRGLLTVALGIYVLDTVLLVLFAATLLEDPVPCALEILTHCVYIGVQIPATMAGHRLSLRKGGGEESNFSKAKQRS